MGDSIIPNKGPKYSTLSIAWWQWANSFGADLPFFNTGGPVDISAHQSGHVWFLAGQSAGAPVVRSGVVPTGTSLFFPLVNLLNDYPCPPAFAFEPPPGETLEHFLQRTASEFLDYYAGNPPNNLFAVIDGVPLTDLSAYKAISPMFTFTGDVELTWWDPCITGTPQDGVSAGYWLLLPPLTPGTHTLHFGSPGGNAGQDITWNLTVTPGK